MLKDILSISGHSGLFKLVSKAKNSIIVESLTDGKRIPVYASNRISALEDISIYTTDGDLKLTDVFITIFDNQYEVDSKVSADNLKRKFQQIILNYDDSKVYVSDIKKIFAWYNLLIDKGIISEETIKSYRESLEEEMKEAEKENADPEEVEEEKTE